MSAAAARGLNAINHQANTVTREGRRDEWEETVLRNQKFYTQPAPHVRGLTAFLVAAGPSLGKNIEELKKVGGRGSIVCVDAAMRALMDAGIVPDYCMALDSKAECQRFVEGLDTSKTTLVAGVTSSPELIENWKGPRFFVNAKGGGGDHAEKINAMVRVVRVKRAIMPGQQLDIEKDIEVEFSGIKWHVAVGGNVSTAASSFCLDILRATKIIMVGADFSWSEDGDFYAGGNFADMGENRKNGEDAFSIKDMNEQEVLTNMSMFSFKNWHEDVARAIPNVFVNATEGGILGVGDAGEFRGKRLENWEFMTLKEAVAEYAPIETRPVPEAVA